MLKARGCTWLKGLQVPTRFFKRGSRRSYEVSGFGLASAGASPNEETGVQMLPEVGRALHIKNASSLPMRRSAFYLEPISISAMMFSC